MHLSSMVQVFRSPEVFFTAHDLSCAWCWRALGGPGAQSFVQRRRVWDPENFSDWAEEPCIKATFWETDFHDAPVAALHSAVGLHCMVHLHASDPVREWLTHPRDIQASIPSTKQRVTGFQEVLVDGCEAIHFGTLDQLNSISISTVYGRGDEGGGRRGKKVASLATSEVFSTTTTS